MSKQPRVLVCDRVSSAGLEVLRQSADVTEAGALAERELITALADCDALVVRSATQVTAHVFDSVPSLKVVGRAGVGVDNIDVGAATRHGVLVVNSPAGNTLAAAEHTIAMLLAAARNIPQANTSMKAGEFDGKRFVGRQVSGKTLGIVGLGRIGSEVARRARALGMELLAFDPYTPPEQAARLGARLVELDEVLQGADFLTVHAPLTDATRGLIGPDALAKVQPHLIVLNCARGGIVDEAALLNALSEGRIAGAALDVFEHEPEFNRELVAHPAVIATPHLGASTSEAQEMVAVDVAEQIVDVLEGRPARTPVNVVALAPEVLVELEPYLSLAEHLGRLANVLTRSAPRELSIAASSATPSDGLPLLAAKIICGILAGRTDHALNDANALVIARERGIEVSHGVSTQDHGYSRYLEVTVRFGQEQCELAGAAIEGEQPRVLCINGFSVDVQPEGECVLIWKRNPRLPGFIGAIGTTLAEAGVGISSIQAGREEIDGAGLLVARVDRAISPELRESIERLPEVARVELVTFEDQEDRA